MHTLIPVLSLQPEPGCPGWGLRRGLGLQYVWAFSLEPGHDTARAGISGRRGSTHQGLAVAKGSRIGHCNRQGARPQEVPPLGSPLLYPRSSLGTFLRISRITQNHQNFRDENFWFQKAKLRLGGRRQAAHDLRPSGCVGAEASLPDSQSGALPHTTLRPWEAKT